MIKETQKQQILSHLQPYRPIRVGIFGSYARNEQRPESDLDILIPFG
jgi:predicted nucleotidyltransferase